VIEKAKQFIGFFLSVAALVGAIYGIIRFIDSRIDTKLNDPSTARRIALAARPEMIINQKGSVLIDRGAMEYIADLKVTQNPKNRGLADTIIITPRRYMANPPLVTALDAAFLHTSAEHGPQIRLDYQT
jgi:hypothetical protein